MEVKNLEPDEDPSESVIRGPRRLTMNDTSSDYRELHRLPIAPLDFFAVLNRI